MDLDYDVEDYTVVVVTSMDGIRVWSNKNVI
jgi:hypothetical protein